MSSLNDKVTAVFDEPGCATNQAKGTKERLRAATHLGSSRPSRLRVTLSDRVAEFGDCRAKFPRRNRPHSAACFLTNSRP